MTWPHGPKNKGESEMDSAVYSLLNVLIARKLNGSALNEAEAMLHQQLCETIRLEMRMINLQLIRALEAENVNDSGDFTQNSKEESP